MGSFWPETRSAALQLETDLPTRYYVPREDVNFDALTASINYSLCSYKGETDEYWSVGDQPEDRECRLVVRGVASRGREDRGTSRLHNQMVDITVDGVAADRSTQRNARTATTGASGAVAFRREGHVVGPPGR